MCASCDRYDYSRNCGVECKDHAWGEPDQEIAWEAEDPAWMYRCARCGCCKIVDEGQGPLGERR